jgi:hypothetical protein
MAMHPNSLANLKTNVGGNKPRYESKKKRRHLTVTTEGWEQAKAIIEEKLGLSVSEAIELIGRGECEIKRLKAKS